MIEEYLEERKKWKEAGKPYRTKEEMERIHSICKSCPLFEAGGGYLPGYDRCGECGCQLHPKSRKLNKIAWGTTECPLETPKWGPGLTPE